MESWVFSRTHVEDRSAMMTSKMRKTMRWIRTRVAALATADFRSKRGADARWCGLEVMEDRVLLNGVTIITHGYKLSGTLGETPWPSAMADAVASRIGAGATVFQLTVDDSGSANTPHVNPIVYRYGPDLDAETNSKAEVVISGAITKSCG